jgi:hypothetical protein
VLLALNGRFDRLLLRRLGPRGAAAGVALHAIHHLTAVAAVPTAVAIHLARPHARARAGGSLVVAPAGPETSPQARAGDTARDRLLTRVPLPELSFVVVTDRFVYVRELVEAMRVQSGSTGSSS